MLNTLFTKLRYSRHRRQEFLKNLGGHGRLVDHEPHLALVGDRRYHVQRDAPGRQRLHRRFPLRGITPTVLAIVFDTRVVTP